MSQDKSHVVVVATGVATPPANDHLFTNAEVIRGFDIKYGEGSPKAGQLWDESLPERRFGIRKRPLDVVVGPDGRFVKRSPEEGGVTGNGLAILAGRQALEEAGIDPAEVGLVIVPTATPDSLCFGNDLSDIRKGLKLSATAQLISISIGCAGFLSALPIAEAMLRARMIRYALILPQNSASTYLANAQIRAKYGPEIGRMVCQVMFSDMAVAHLLELRPGNVGFLGHGFLVDEECRLMEFRGKVKGHDFLGIEDASFLMNSDAVRDKFPRLMRQGWEMAQPTMGAYGISLSEITDLVCHQASGPAIDAMIKQLRGQLPDTLLDNPAAVRRIMGEWGNPAVASAPIVHALILREKKPGVHVGLMVGAGYGGGQHGYFVYRQE